MLRGALETLRTHMRVTPGKGLLIKLLLGQVEPHMAYAVHERLESLLGHVGMERLQAPYRDPPRRWLAPNRAEHEPGDRVRIVEFARCVDDDDLVLVESVRSDRGLAIAFDDPGSGDRARRFDWSVRHSGDGRGIRLGCVPSSTARDDVQADSLQPRGPFGRPGQPTKDNRR